MNYIESAFHRVNPSQISSFLLYGTESYASKRPYDQWTEDAHEAMMAQLLQLIPDKDTLNSLLNLIYSYAGSVETLSMEIGLKAGARLMLSLLQDHAEK